MPKIVFRAGLVIMAALAIGFCFTACGTRDIQEEGAVVAPTGESFQSITPTVVERPTQEVPQEIDRGPSDVLGLISIDQSLSGLSSYIMKSEISFTGTTGDSDPFDWTVSWQTASSQQPPATRLDITTSGFDPSANITSMSLARVGGETYLAIEGSGCVSGDDIGFQTASVATINPDNYISGLRGAVLVAEDRVINGIPSSVYHFDEEAIPLWQNSPVSVEGEIYVANDGGFVTGLTLSATGSADFTGSGQVQEGSFQLSVDVSDVNEPLEIQPPLSCTNTAGFPVPKDAFDIAYFEDLISYRSKMPLDDMVEYYRQEMAELGWILEAEDSDVEDSALLTYQKDGLTISVYMTVEEGNGSVEVIIAP